MVEKEGILQAERTVFLYDRLPRHARFSPRFVATALREAVKHDPTEGQSRRQVWQRRGALLVRAGALWNPWTSFLSVARVPLAIGLYYAVNPKDAQPMKEVVADTISGIRAGRSAVVLERKKRKEDITQPMKRKERRSLYTRAKKEAIQTRQQKRYEEEFAKQHEKELADIAGKFPQASKEMMINALEKKAFLETHKARIEELHKLDPQEPLNFIVGIVEKEVQEKSHMRKRETKLRMYQSIFIGAVGSVVFFTFLVKLLPFLVTGFISTLTYSVIARGLLPKVTYGFAKAKELYLKKELVGST